MTDGAVGERPVLRIAAGNDDHAVASELIERAEESQHDVRVREVGSTGHPEVEPLALATSEGETVLVEECTETQLDGLLESLAEGELPTASERLTVEHAVDTAGLPRPDSGPLAVGDSALLGGCGWAVPGSVADYEARGRVASERGGEEIHKEIADLGFRGRGRGDASADEPVAETWNDAAGAEGDPVVVINGNEADHRVQGDRLLLESDPISVLDGALAAARAVEATEIVVYLGEADPLARERIETAIDAAESEGFGFPPIGVVTGPEEFMAGEPTMALEALEGNHRLEARLRPPYPSTQGLDGRPTLVHTPRTLAGVAGALRGLTEDLGTGSDPGTRLVTVSAEGAGRATVELGTNQELAAATTAIGFDGRLKAACVGGVFGGVTRSLSVPAGANALEAADLGTDGAIELFDSEQSMVAFAGTRASFAEEENCGRCVPCREGTTQLTNLLREVYEGSYDGEAVRELSRVMSETSICSFGQHAARPVRTALASFETEFRGLAAESGGGA